MAEAARRLDDDARVGVHAYWFRVDGLVAATTNGYIVWQQPDGCTAVLKVFDNDEADRADLVAAIEAFIRGAKHHHASGGFMSQNLSAAALPADDDSIFCSRPDSHVQTMVAARRICAVLLSMTAERKALVRIYVARPPGPTLMPISYDAVMAPQHGVARFLSVVASAAAGSARILT